MPAMHGVRTASSGGLIGISVFSLAPQPGPTSQRFQPLLLPRYAPDVKERHWYWITPGSVVGVLLWALSSLALRGYLHFFNSYSKTYGSLGAVIILMLWFYITGLAFLVGGEINLTIEHAAAEHGHPEAKAEGQKAA